MKESDSQDRKFEETYPRYEFSELVRLAVGLATLMRRTGKSGPRRAAGRPRPLSWPRFGKQLF